ncbi:MAG: hypothetical protein ACE5R4_02355 [Armatimonadota bacterium]
MRAVAALSCVLALVFMGGVWAEQIGGPSEPSEQGLSIGAEGIFRNLEGHFMVQDQGIPLNGDGGVVAQNTGYWPSERVRLTTETYYGVAQYAITDRLSIRGKAGISDLELDFGRAGSYEFENGFAWAAGAQYRICAPAGEGTSLALSGQFARSEPDDYYGVVGPVLNRFVNPKVEEINVALTVGSTKGSTRPYAGIVWTDFMFEFERLSASRNVIVFPEARQLPMGRQYWCLDRQRVGGVFGLQQSLGGSGWLGVEARAWDESSIAATLSLGF